jgi:hypothetical protein
MPPDIVADLRNLLRLLEGRSPGWLSAAETLAVAKDQVLLILTRRRRGAYRRRPPRPRRDPRPPVIGAMIEDLARRFSLDVGGAGRHTQDQPLTREERGHRAASG